MHQPRDFISHAKKLGALTLATSILGFLREFAIAYKFGATHATDAYLIALTIPSLLYAFLIGSGLNISVTPRLSSLLIADPRTGAKRFAELLSVLVVVGVLGSLLIFVFAGSLVQTFAPGVASSSLAVDFARWLSPLFFLFVVTYSLASFQCARHRPPYWALVGLFQNAVLVLVVLSLASIVGFEAILIGTLAGASLALMVQIYLARRAGFDEPWTHPLRASEGLKILVAMIPFALAFGVGGDAGTSQVDIFLVRFFASRLDPGSITLLALGNKLMGLPVVLVGSVLGLAVLPSASVAFSRDNTSDGASNLIQAWGYALLLICPVFVLYLDEGSQITRLVFGHGAMSPANVTALGGIVRAYALAVVGLTLVYVLSGFLAALRKTQALIVSGIATVALNACLMHLLASRYGAAGIALAISIGSFFHCSVIAVPLFRRLGSSVLVRMAKLTGLTVVGALGMHLILQSTVRLDLLDSIPLLGHAILPGLAGLTAYGVWLSLCRSRLRLASVQVSSADGTVLYRGTSKQLGFEGE